MRQLELDASADELALVEQALMNALAPKDATAIASASKASVEASGRTRKQRTNLEPALVAETSPASPASPEVKQLWKVFIGK